MYKGKKLSPYAFCCAPGISTKTSQLSGSASICRGPTSLGMSTYATHGTLGQKKKEKGKTQYEDKRFHIGARDCHPLFQSSPPRPGKRSWMKKLAHGVGSVSLFDTYVHVSAVSDLVTIGIYKLARWWTSTLEVGSDRLLIPQAAMTRISADRCASSQTKFHQSPSKSDGI